MMRSVGSYEFKTHLSKMLADVEHGQTLTITRHGKPIARISPAKVADPDAIKQAVRSLIDFPRTRLPKGVTIKRLIEDGRR